MNPDTEATNSRPNMEETKRQRRPPSSYGSMKSDDEEMEEEGEESPDEEEVDIVLPDATAPETTGLRLIRSESPETVFTMATQHPPPGAGVIDTRSDPESSPEEEDERYYIVNSPEPPEPLEQDDTTETEEDRRRGRLHPQQALSHVFTNILNSLRHLSWEELLKFKLWFKQFDKNIIQPQTDSAMEGDLLDFVDKMIESLGMDSSLNLTITTLESIGKKSEAAELRHQCTKAFIRYHLKEHLLRKHSTIREGVIRPGRWNFLDKVYVEPQISRHPSSDTFVGLSDLFRLQTDDSKPVRTVLTTGIPGIGMSVSVGKFCLDWAEKRAYRDFQFTIQLSFRSLWSLQNKDSPSSHGMSLLEIIEHCHPECKGLSVLQEADCRSLIIMDSFDCYQATLDWKNAPVITDINTQAPADVLIVNILRGNLLPTACIWILGRHAAVSQIPPALINAGTEIRGFSEDMLDDYLSRRFSDPQLAANVVRQSKLLPSLRILARLPFVSWMVATVFERCYQYRDYGKHPPRLTPFYVNFLVVQTNRRLQFYKGKHESDLKWSSEDQKLVMKMGHMAFKLLERRADGFFEEDVRECGLDVREVTVWSGLCTELSNAGPDRRRKYCFIHHTFQEFMAALYVFAMFYTESKIILCLPKSATSKSRCKSVAHLVHCALVQTHGTTHYDMFLRFLCGLLSPHCHNMLLAGFLFPHNTPVVSGLDEVQRLLEQEIRETPSDRVDNVKESLREMTQVDE